jgi:hypothetical protein
VRKARTKVRLAAAARPSLSRPMLVLARCAYGASLLAHVGEHLLERCRRGAKDARIGRAQVQDHVHCACDGDGAEQARESTSDWRETSTQSRKTGRSSTQSPHTVGVRDGWVCRKKEPGQIAQRVGHKRKAN